MGLCHPVCGYGSNAEETRVGKKSETMGVSFLVAGSTVASRVEKLFFCCT